MPFEVLLLCRRHFNPTFQQLIIYIEYKIPKTENSMGTKRVKLRRLDIPAISHDFFSNHFLIDCRFLKLLLIASFGLAMLCNIDQNLRCLIFLPTPTPIILLPLSFNFPAFSMAIFGASIMPWGLPSVIKIIMSFEDIRLFSGFSNGKIWNIM